MRINVYSQELTNECEMVSKESNTGIFYSAVRLFLHSSDKLHHPPEDDDRSAITFWLPGSEHRCLELADTLRQMADMVEAVIVSDNDPSVPIPLNHDDLGWMYRKGPCR